MDRAMDLLIQSPVRAIHLDKPQSDKRSMGQADETNILNYTTPLLLHFLCSYGEKVVAG